MSKNDWTNKLRDQLADYQEPVNHDLWAGIESSLAHKSAGRKARLVSIKRWSVAAAAVALLGVGGGYVYLHQGSEGVKNALAVMSKHSTAVSKASAHGQMPDNVDSEGANLLAADCKSAERLTEASVAVSKASAHGQMQDNVDSDGAYLLAADYKSAERLTEAQAVATDGEPEAASARKMEVSPVRKINSAPSRKIEGTSSSYESPDFDFASSKSHGIDWSVNLYAENVVANSQSSPSQGVMLASNPSSGGQFYDDGIFVNPGDFSDKTTFFAAASPWLRSSRYQKAKHHAPLSVGMQVGIGILPRLTLSTGVVYTRAASDFQPNGVDEYTVHQVLHYVGVPLGVNYRVWGKSGFSAYVMAGGEADFNVKNDTENSGYKEDAKCDRPQFSAKASLGLQYDIAPQVGLYLEPGAKYYFDNGSSIENTFKDKKLNFNFQFGLRWNIGK